jgi:UDP-N-acetylmuramoyl-L-alanyl-D-glutamate--2,6-diaminopimelate ligase
VRVADARVAVAELACAFYQRPSSRLQMFGVTGTNGKTTTTYMIRDILRADGREPGLIGTVEYQIGARVIPASRTTPDAPTLQSLLAQMVGAGCRSAVMEISSHALHQHRTHGTAYDVGVFTNLTREHLDYHETLEKYFDAKALLFQSLGRMEKHAVAVVNIDDPWGQKLAQMKDLQADILTYGVSADAMVRAQEIDVTPQGTRFRARTPWDGLRIETRLLGRFNVSNALAAIAACGATGTRLDLMEATLSAMSPVPGRLEEIRTTRGFSAFVDYAHTDDALEHVLTTLRELTARRLIVVFGCGGNRDRSKRPAMGQVAARLADYSILTSDNPRREDPAAILQQIREGFGTSTQFETIENRGDAIRRAMEMAGEGDVVLVAGKGHESFQEFANTTLPFDDREVVRRYA